MFRRPTNYMPHETLWNTLKNNEIMFYTEYYLSSYAIKKKFIMVQNL